MKCKPSRLRKYKLHITNDKRLMIMHETKKYVNLYSVARFQQLITEGLIVR